MGNFTPCINIQNATTRSADGLSMKTFRIRTSCNEDQQNTETNEKASRQSRAQAGQENSQVPALQRAGVC
jgi:hypothetical protein